MTDYLIVYGQNVQRGLPCYKESSIDCNELIKFSSIIKEIIKNLNKQENWAGGRTLEKIGELYIEHVHLYEMYPNFDSLLLDEFNNYLPDGITHIESIKIFRGEKIKII